MQTVLSVDLASKFSAFCVLDDKGQVHEEGDSRGMSPFDFADALSDECHYGAPDLIVLEDVPYGINSQFQVKPVLRLQGILISKLRLFLDNTVFVNPSTWQRSYPGVARGEKAARELAARTAAAELGYTPPPLVDDWTAQCQEDGKKVLKKDTNPLAKNETDYIDAFLMAHWAQQQDDIWSLSGVQPVMI